MSTSSPARPHLRALAAAAVLALALTACTTEETASDPAGSEESSASTSTPTEGASQEPDAEESPEAAGACEYAADGAPAAKEVEPPAAEPTTSTQTPVTISLSSGDLSATLDASTAPCTVNNFLSLAEQGYFDDTVCHRLTTEGIFVLQCGDPSATGMGGPGYSFADELSGTETYGAGTLAMANSGPDTNGSQFFIVYADTQLPPAYTVFGQIDEAGVTTVQEIADAGTAEGTPDGAPAQEVRITGVTAG